MLLIQSAGSNQPRHTNLQEIRLDLFREHAPDLDETSTCYTKNGLVVSNMTFIFNDTWDVIPTPWTSSYFSRWAHCTTNQMGISTSCFGCEIWTFRGQKNTREQSCRMLLMPLPAAFNRFFSLNHRIG